MSEQPIRILLVGVGGQGALTTAQILGKAALSSKLSVSIGQLHGMAQRGGAVESTVVFGSSRTAFIGAGQADLVLGFEPLETLRALPKMSERSHVVMNRDRITPLSMTLADIGYPELESIESSIRSVTPRLTAFDATDVARRAGNKRAIGTVLLGVAARLQVLPVDEASLRETVERNCREHALAANRRAFALGTEVSVQANRAAILQNGLATLR